MTPMESTSGLRASVRLALESTTSRQGDAGGDPAHGATGPWTEPLRQVQQALDRRDIRAMLRAWNVAALAARHSEQWEAYVAIGDAALRIAFATGFQIAFAAEARHAYLLALGRAHRQQSIAGVVRVAQGFAAIGDEDLVEQCLHLADRLRDE